MNQKRPCRHHLLTMGCLRVHQLSEATPYYSFPSWVSAVWRLYKWTWCDTSIILGTFEDVWGCRSECGSSTIPAIYWPNCRGLSLSCLSISTQVLSSGEGVHMRGRDLWPGARWIHSRIFHAWLGLWNVPFVASEYSYGTEQLDKWFNRLSNIQAINIITEITPHSEVRHALSCFTSVLATRSWDRWVVAVKKDGVPLCDKHSAVESFVVKETVLLETEGIRV